MNRNYSPDFAERVLNWFEQHGRKHLPWQQDITPYRVWISEIMLQQTQVATVIPYYERFMQRFPNVTTLAQAELDEVLHHWSGLGYYSRAKNLHKAACMLEQEFNGEFPVTLDDVIQLPGIGRSTAGAILAISRQVPAAILDGNVKRVLARFHAIEGWPGQSHVLQQLWDAAEHYTPTQRVHHYTQAMMDLGATVCTRSKPNCDACPLARDCAAKSSGNISAFPGKKPKKTLPEKSTRMLVLRHGDDIWLQQRPLTGIWPGLWGFPEISPDADVDNALQQLLGPNGYRREALPGFRHTFSHYHLDIEIEHVTLEQKPQHVMEDQQQLWYNMAAPQAVGLAAPVTKILKKIS